MPTDVSILGTLLAIVAIVALVALFGWRRARYRPHLVDPAPDEMDPEVEGDAVELLTELGFEVLESGVEQGWTLGIDGESRRIECRADLLVEKDNRLFVAAIKGQREAADPTLPSTRRQLLEYLLVFSEVDGVLVVDVAAGKVHKLDFSSLLERA